MTALAETGAVCMFRANITLAPVPVARDTSPRLVAERPSMDAIRAVQGALAELPQLDLPPKHLFAPGMYVRALPIPAGSFVVGKQHRHAHPVMLVKGETTILTDKGMERICAPHVWVSEPGAKRLLYTHTDCEFVTVHLNPTDTTDLDQIEAEHIIPEPLLAHETPAALAGFADDLQRMYA